MVSVIVPNYNHSRYLNRRIDSILNQSYQNFELIILDDCSSDDSRQVIEGYRNHPKVTDIVFNTTNNGCYGQWEKGIRMGKGEYVWIADSDDYAEPFFLEKLVSGVENNNNVGIAFCGSYWVNSDNEKKEDLSIYKDSFFKIGTEEIKTGLCRYCTIHTGSSAIMLRSLAEKHIEGISTYKSCGDWVLYTRMLQDSNLVFVQDKLNNFRWYHQNISNEARRMGTWVVEGIDVLKNIDYKKVKFSFREFLSLVKWWVKQSSPLPLAKRKIVYAKALNTLLYYIKN